MKKFLRYSKSHILMYRRGAGNEIWDFLLEFRVFWGIWKEMGGEKAKENEEKGLTGKGGFVILISDL